MDHLTSALLRYYGFAGFRPGQREACEAALAGRDVLVVMPTGSGKSLCYQLPALLREDLTIVVSPLVALMQDQVEALRARRLGDRVALVNAQQDPATNAAALDRAAHGELRLLYVAPERFSSPGFVERIAEARVGLFVVDEAHCVSQWGHDFRPDYFRLADAARHLGTESVVASTATATPRVASDVARRLRLRDPVRVATGFDRPNLSFAVVRPAPHEKRPLLTEALSSPGALPAIVYAGTRAGAEEIAAELGKELGEEVLAYHAGLDRERRAAVQRRFLADEAPVVVATNAFGMGVDKPNVRTVVHATVPGSLEAYYQEAGRAGRDGAPSRALLLAENRDKALHVHFIRRDELDERLPRRLAAQLAERTETAMELGDTGQATDGRATGAGATGARATDGQATSARYSADAAELADAVGCNPDQLRALVGHLSRAGVLQPSPAAPDRLTGRLLGPFDRRAARLCHASMTDGARARWRQYREIWAYVESGACRRRAILRHFGDRTEPAPARRGMPLPAAEGRDDGSSGGGCCDVCDPGLAPELPAPDASEAKDLDEAILLVARAARPSVGRTTCAEILHGARTKKIARNAYDGLPAYGSSSNRSRAEIVARVDALLAEGRLATTGGRYPVLQVPGQ